MFDCGERFRLERAYGITAPPRWATVGGSGFHTFSEYYDQALALGERVTDFWDEKDLEVSSRAESVYRPHEMQEEHWERTLALREERKDLETEIKALAVVAVALAPKDPGSGECQPGEGGSQEGHDVITELWRASFQHAILEDLEGLLRKNPEQADEHLFRNSAKGKAGKDFPDGENKAWWNHHGPVMLQKYITWRRTSGWQLAFIGLPAIELDVSCTLPGTQIKLAAYLDRVFLNPVWSPAMPSIVDLKSGRAPVKEPEQLGMYATCLELLGLPRPEWGHYYDARKGVLGEAYHLGEYTIEFFEWKYQRAKYVRDNGLLQPNTASQFCRSCEVRPYCFAVGGDRANEIPRPWVEAQERRKLSIQPVNTEVFTDRNVA